MPNVGRVFVALITMAVIMLATSRAEAQRPLTIAAGPNFSTVSGDAVDDPETRTGFFVGVGTGFPVSPSVSIQPFVGYVQKGWKEGDDFDVKLTYLEVPVFLSYMFPMGTSGSSISVGAGPQVSFNLGCDQTFFDDTIDCEDAGNNIKSLDYGVLAGVDVSFPLGSLMGSIGGGYDLGLSEFAENDAGENLELKNRGFWISVAITTVLGG